ncbi:hypothetical protein RI049_09700 [Cedecea neteri]|uniref:hypothetical protein n=1 Tax=Cedecea neteri TaxID=158822 RepID=UPI002AA77E34|nr:hypothetical protein [Cedecea neteri]WPU24987.1 hypothetical protein RI049_09700 [Cedecea neteri]
MFKILRRNIASAKLRKYMAHWMEAMSLTFKNSMAGNYIDLKDLDRISIVIISAAITELKVSSGAIMACVADVAFRAGLTEDDLSYLPYQVLAITKGVEGRTPLESKKGMLGLIVPSYEFSEQDTKWFDTNIEIISKQLNNDLHSVVSVLRD